MKILREQILELDTPYMLRKDGELISCKDLMIHPYIELLPAKAKNKKEAFDYLLANGALDDYKWFIKHSLDKHVKLQLQRLLDNKFDINSLDLILLELRQLTNQEFCRVRTSGKFLGSPENKEIFFRISSFGFNWFDLIWKVVIENKNRIDYITVCTDARAKGYDQVYKYRGMELNQLSVDKFLELPGQPIIEKVINENKATTKIQEDLEWN